MTVGVAVALLAGCGRYGFSDLHDQGVDDANQVAGDAGAGLDAGGSSDTGFRFDLGGNGGADGGGTRPASVVVVTGIGSIAALAVDETHLYWATSGQIRRINKTTRTNPTTVVVGATADSLAVDATHVYWTDNFFEEVARAPKTGGEEETIADLTASPQEIVVDGQYAYWPTEGDTNLLQRIVKQGGAAPELVSQSGLPDDIACDADFVYWTSETGGADLNRFNKTTRQVDTVLSVGTVRDLAVKEQFIYYATPSSITRVSKVGINTFTMVMAQPEIGSFAAADSFIAWTNRTQNGDIRRVPIGGGSIEVLETNLVRPDLLLADGDTLYWAIGNRIMVIDF